MKYRRLVLSLPIIAAAGSAGSQNRDPYVGEWAGDCGNSAQCWLEIEQREAKTYDVQFVMADRLNADKVICKETIAMKRRPLKFNANEEFPDSLAGSIPSDKFLFILPGQGSISFVTEADCKGTRISGEYTAIGD